jgi:HSP20 family protein
MTNLIRRREDQTRRTGELAARTQLGWDPYRLMAEMLRWDPLREVTGFGAPMTGFVPDFDVRETKDGYVFAADLPGLREEDVDISLTGNTLTVSGRRTGEEIQESEQAYCAERMFGEFRRSFALPEGADPDSANAELKNGVLRITLSKRPEVQPKRIALGAKAGQPGTKA